MPLFVGLVFHAATIVGIDQRKACVAVHLYCIALLFRISIMSFYDEDNYFPEELELLNREEEEEKEEPPPEPEEEEAAQTEEEFRIDSSGRPSMKYLDGDKFKDANLRSVVQSIISYFTKGISFGNDIFTKPYTEVYDRYGSTCNKKGDFPPELKQYLSYRNPIAEVAVALFRTAHQLQKGEFPEHNFMYGEEIDRLFLQLMGKLKFPGAGFSVCRSADTLSLAFCRCRLHQIQYYQKVDESLSSCDEFDYGDAR